MENTENLQNYIFLFPFHSPTQNTKSLFFFEWGKGNLTAKDAEDAKMGKGKMGKIF